MTRHHATTTILFVCTGNICRSPMAEGLMSQILSPQSGIKFEVISAGTHGLEGNRAEPHAVQAMATFDIDISKHRGRQVSVEMITRADWVLVMEKAHQHWLENHFQSKAKKSYRLTEFGKHPAAKNIPDPYGGPLQTYLHCAGLIQRCIQEFTAHLMT